MAANPPSGRDPNPYAAPEASLTEAPLATAAPADLARAEAIRRAYISHESSVKALGVLGVGGGALFLSGGLVFAVVALTGRAGATGLGATGTVGIALAVVVLGCLNLATGLGLRGLLPWARWLVAVATGLSLLSSVVRAILSVYLLGGAAGGALVLGVLPGMLIPGYIFSLMVSKKGAVVFSPEYKEIVATTPHVKMKTSWIVKGCLIVLVAFLTLLVIAFVFNVLGVAP